MNRKTKICFIASSGGHLEEIKQLKKVIEKYDNYFIVAKSKATIEQKTYKYKVYDINRNNKIFTLFTYIITFFQQLIIFIKERPTIVITTGPGMVLPTCILSKIFKKKIIFIESFARISSPSRTGMFLYKYADLFLIQNEQLKQFYPNSIYGGGVF